MLQSRGSPCVAAGCSSPADIAGAQHGAVRTHRQIKQTNLYIYIEGRREAKKQAKKDGMKEGREDRGEGRKEERCLPAKQ